MLQCTSSCIQAGTLEIAQEKVTPRAIMSQCKLLLLPSRNSLNACSV